MKAHKHHDTLIRELDDLATLAEPAGTCGNVGPILTIDRRNITPRRRGVRLWVGTVDGTYLDVEAATIAGAIGKMRRKIEDSK